MPFHISPNIQIQEIGQLSLDRKIEIFKDRMNGWIFEPFNKIDQINFSGKSFVILKLSVTIVELYAKYTIGATTNSSKQFYKNGLQMIFPRLSDTDAELFYKSVRNPLYHLGLTASNVLISEDTKFPFMIKDHLFILINPKRFVDAVERKFRVYLRDLSNPVNTTIREKFEIRLDYDNNEIYKEVLGKDYDTKLLENFKLERAVD